MLKVNEIYYSIQGESTSAGLPCVFVRLTYCNLRCAYCDTEYAFYEGKDYSIDGILTEVKRYDCKLVEITGGEPLVQDECFDLMKKLCDEGFKVLLETGGSIPINNVDKRVKIIMDLKCPSSQMMKKNLYENIDHIKATDEIKFVIGNREDYEWTKDIMATYDLSNKGHVLLSPAYGMLDPQDLIQWMLKDRINARLNLQLHKYIFGPDTRGK